MARKIEIYDTTLRDGSQGLGIHFSVADKVRVAQELERFGVAYIEGGWPGSNPKDMEFFDAVAKRKFKHAKVAAFGTNPSFLAATTTRAPSLPRCSGW